MSSRKNESSRTATLVSLERRHRIGAVIDQVGLTARLIVVAATVIFLGMFARDAVIALAGKTTNANVLLEFFGHLEVTVAIAWGAAATAAIWGYRERSLRRSTTKRLSTQIEDLELLVDPGRTSSNLSRTGQTNPKDK